MKLITKNLINVTVMTVIVSIVVGYFGIKNSDEILYENLKHQVDLDNKKIINHIDSIKSTLKQVSKNIVKNKTVKSSLNLISNYEEKENYNHMIFDNAKSNLIEESDKFFVDNEFFEIRFYDKQRALVAKKKFNEKLGKSGYVIYDNAIAYFKDNSSISKLSLDTKLQSKCIGKIRTHYESGYYKTCHTKTIVFNKAIIGYTKVIYYFGKEELSKLEESLLYPISFSKEEVQKNSFKSSVLDKELNLYLKHHIDLNYIKKKEKEFLLEMVFVVMGLIIFTFVMFLIFIKKEVLQPFYKIQEALNSILENRYRPITIKTDDEIGKIFKSSNKIFEKFWDSYSSLKGYQKSIETSNIVIKIDFDGNITYANKLFYQTSGYKKCDIIGKSYNTVCCEDIDTTLYKQMCRISQKGNNYRREIKNKIKNGGCYWVDAVLSPIYDSNEKIQEYIFVQRDISQQKEQEILLENSKKEYKTLLENIPGITYRCKYDKDWTMIFITHEVENVFGYTKYDLIDNKFISYAKIIFVEDSLLIEKVVSNAIEKKKPWEIEYRVKSKNGTTKYVHEKGRAVFDSNNSVKYLDGVILDITDKKRLERISINDGLTHVFNRRHFDDIFPKIINNRKRKNEWVCFLMIDIDHFKQYNDNYGHQAGDDVLIKFATCLKENLKRADDLAFRLGGEEFGIVYKADTKEKALVFANTIKTNIEKMKIPHDYSSTSSYVTCSMGLVCKRANEINCMNEIYKQADDLLYKSKQNGRNQVSVNAV